MVNLRSTVPMKKISYQAGAELGQAWKKLRQAFQELWRTFVTPEMTDILIM